jgi:signal transduction histidine kinase
VLVVDRNNHLLLANPAAREIFYIEPDAVGRPMQEAIYNDDMVNAFQTSKERGRFSTEIPMTDGRTFYASLSPIAGSEATGGGWVATLQDVTHFKELDSLKTDFVNAVSHDLRSPLSGILIATHLIPMTGELNEKQNEFIHTIEKRVSSMTELIDDLLDVGKIEAGIDMEMEDLDLIPMVQDVVDGHREQAEQKGLKLGMQLPESVTRVTGNSTRLRQLIANLVSNAIKYTLEGDVTIRISEQDMELMLEVEDTGIGIAPGEQPLVFDKFYRVKAQETSDVGGTGLGLAITKSIVEKHQGRIWVESAVGKGSNFVVVFPTVNYCSPEENEVIKEAGQQKKN